jgi:hypothetical protein
MLKMGGMIEVRTSDRFRISVRDVEAVDVVAVWDYGHACGLARSRVFF